MTSAVPFTSSYSLPSLSITECQAQNLIVTGVVLIVLASAAYQKGLINGKITFTAILAGGAAIATGLFGAPKRVDVQDLSPDTYRDELRTRAVRSAQWSLTHDELVVGNERNEAKLAVALAHLSPGNENYQEQFREILADFSNYSLSFFNSQASMEWTLLQLHINPTHTNFDEYCKRFNYIRTLSKNKMSIQCLSTLISRTPKQTFYDLFKSHVQKGKFGIHFLLALIAALPKMCDIDVVEESQYLVGIAKDYIGYGRELTETHAMLLSALMAGLAELPRDQSQPAISEILTSQQFQLGENQSHGHSDTNNKDHESLLDVMINTPSIATNIENRQVRRALIKIAQCNPTNPSSKRIQIMLQMESIEFMWKSNPAAVLKYYLDRPLENIPHIIDHFFDFYPFAERRTQALANQLLIKMLRSRLKCEVLANTLFLIVGAPTVEKVRRLRDNGEWRPRNASQYPPEIRAAMRTLVTLARTGT